MSEDGIMCVRDHALLKSDDTQWSQLKYIGIQHVRIPNQEPYALELRNCTCESTLARRVAK